MELKRGTALLWRAPGLLQVGADPENHIYIDDVSATEQVWLSELADRASRQMPGSVAPCPANTLPTPPGALRIVARLKAAGFLAEQTADRTSLVPPVETLSIRIDGVEAISIETAQLLRRLGVTHFDVRDSRNVDSSLDGYLPATDYATSRRHALSSLLKETHERIYIGHVENPDIVIVSRPRTTDPVATGLLLVEDQPHLLITCRESSVDVGPFVIPGKTPCGQCIELELADYDRLWPLISQEMPQWPLANPPLSMTLSAAIEASRTILNYAGSTSMGTSPLITPGSLLSRVNTNGSVRHIELHAHPRCECGAAHAPFSTPIPVECI